MNYFSCGPAYNQSAAVACFDRRAVTARPRGFQQFIQEGQYLC
jgi:hypothetical protein